jgi:chromosome partitioning protein
MALVITVAQQKGGSGKTSLAAHLSVAWANPQRAEAGEALAPLKVIALDLDPQESLTKWFEVRAASGESTGTLEVRRAAGWRLSGELMRARREASIVILDLPPGTEGSAPAAFRAADLVVVPLQLSPMDLWATGPTIDMVKKSGSHPLLVLNRVPARARLNDIVIAEAKGAEWPVARAMLGNRVLFAESLMAGKGVTEGAPSSLAAAELRLLAREVMSTTRSFASAA